MHTIDRTRLHLFLLLFVFLVPLASVYGGQPQGTGEVRFTTDTQDQRDSGVWIDGKYAGYVKELKGDRKVMLAAGPHEFVIKQAGYKDLTKEITVTPGQVQTIAVVLEENPKLTYPGNDAEELRIDVLPKRAAVFVDDSYMGHGGDFSGRFHSMLVSPGKHHLRLTLNGYQTYETDFTANASSKAEMRVVLQKNTDATPQ